MESECNMNTEQIIDKLIPVIASIFSNNEIKNVTLHTQFSELGIDSVSFIQLIVEMENEFDIEFSDDDLMISEFETIKDLVARIENLLGGN
jgi:acyl carrier protein